MVSSVLQQHANQFVPFFAEEKERSEATVCVTDRFLATGFPGSCIF